MDKKTLVVKLAVIVSTLEETTKPGEAVPASMIYLGMGSDLDLYNTVARMGVSVGWLTTTPETVTLTAKGRAKAKEFQALGV